MERYDLLYRLYDDFDTVTLREYQEFVDLFPAVDSRVALEHWQRASEELERRKDVIRDAFAAGETFAEIASRATREQAFSALDLHAKYGRAVTALVLDVDETLRSAGRTDNEIPRTVLHQLSQFHGEGIPIVICTGQTLENVKGFAIQGLGSEIVHSGDLSIVYEGGTGVFSPGHGGETKVLCYEDLDDESRSIFDDVRGRVLPDAPGDLRRQIHLQGNEFNVTLKPNYQTGSPRARAVVRRGLVHLLDLLGEAVTERVDGDSDLTRSWTRAYYADRDPEIRGALEAEGEYPPIDSDETPVEITAALDRIGVAYYESDAAELTSVDLDKAAGVDRAFDVLGVEEPFTLVMGDSKSDLRVMEWIHERDAGIAAAPEHASERVLEHVLATDELVFSRGRSVDVLRTIGVLNRLARLP